MAKANVEAFAKGNSDLLLATTVIENGVDIVVKYQLMYPARLLKR